MKNQIKNTIKKLLATGLTVGLCASFAVSGAFPAPIEASAAEPITLYDTSGFVDYTSVPLKRDLGTEFQLPDIKRYRMTVKWTVEDANNDDGNYIKLYGYKLKETTTDEQSIYTDEIEEYTIRDAAKNGGEHTATVDMYSLPIKMTYHCHGSVANTSRWYITSLCIDTGDNNVNEWLNPEPSFGIAREEPFWDGKIGIEIEHFAGGDNGITLFFDKKNVHFGDWERDDVGDHKQAWTGSYDKNINNNGTKPFWTFNPNENCTFHWNISIPTDGSTLKIPYKTGIVVDYVSSVWPIQYYDPDNAIITKKSLNHVGAYIDEEVYTPTNSPVVKMDDEYIYFPSSANRDHDYRYDVDIPVAGGRYDSLCFFITTFDYTVTFLDKDGTVLDTQTVKYGESATAPVPPGMPHEDGYTYSCYWTGDSYENITSGPKDRTVKLESYLKHKDSVTYIDENGQEKTITDFVVLTETDLMDNYGYNLPRGTYLVDKDLTFSSEITLNGDVKLIIADGATLNVVAPSYYDTMTIFATDNYDLNIYGQKEGTGRINLETHGDRVLRVGFMKVYGCDITVNGEIYCISEFSIDRGSVTVNKNNNNIAGITVKGDMYVNGGKITVNGYGDITGDPYYDGNNGIDAYNIYISGGEVVSLGNDAGIHAERNLVISGGIVKATGMTDGIYVERLFYYTGGRVNAYGDGDGIHVLGKEMYLSYSSADDYIKANTYKVKKISMIYQGDDDTRPATGYVFTDKSYTLAEYKGSYDTTADADTVATMENAYLVPKGFDVELPEGVTVSGNGVTVNGNTVNAAPALPVKLSVSDDAGFTISDLTVKDADGNTVMLSSDSFIMPDNDVAVYVSGNNYEKTVRNARSRTVVWNGIDLQGDSEAELSFSSAPEVSGYQIQWSTDEDFSDASEKTISKEELEENADNIKARISELKNGSKYYFRIRTYTIVHNPETDADETVYGEWSEIRSIGIALSGDPGNNVPQSGNESIPATGEASSAALLVCAALFSLGTAAILRKKREKE